MSFLIAGRHRRDCIKILNFPADRHIIDNGSRSFEVIPSPRRRCDRCMDTRTAAEPVPVVDDLHLALTTCASFQSSIQHADAKAAVLLTLAAGVAALPASDPLATRSAVPPVVGLVAVGAVLSFGLVGTLWHLGRCIRPRLSGPAGY